MPQSQTPKKHNWFWPALAVFALASFIRYSRDFMSTYTTTYYALNYNYGFIPHGFLGTLYQRISEHLPWEMQNHMAVFNFNGVVTIFYFLVLFLFLGICMHRCPEDYKRNLKHVILFLSIFAFPVFMGSKNFGSVYLYLSILTLLSIIVLFSNILEWLVIPFRIIAMCIHEDFLFLHASLIVVILLWKIFIEKNMGKKIYHLMVMILFSISIIGLWVYFTYYSQYIGDPLVIAEELKPAAKALSQDGLTYNSILIKHELLGMDLAPIVAEFYQDNAIDFPVFCLLFAPYIYFGIRFFIKLIKDESSTFGKRVLYLAMFLGGTSMIPLFINKIDYGVYIYTLFFYYIVIVILGITIQDEKIHHNFDSLKMELKEITSLNYIWLLYPFLLTPFKGVTISTQVHNLAEILFTELGFFLPTQLPLP